MGKFSIEETIDRNSKYLFDELQPLELHHNARAWEEKLEKALSELNVQDQKSLRDLGKIIFFWSSRVTEITACYSRFKRGDPNDSKLRFGRSTNAIEESLVYYEAWLRRKTLILNEDWRFICSFISYLRTSIILLFSCQGINLELTPVYGAFNDYFSMHDIINEELKTNSHQQSIHKVIPLQQNEALPPQQTEKPKPELKLNEFFVKRVSSDTVAAIQNEFRELDGKDLAILIYLLHKEYKMIEILTNSRTKGRKGFVKCLKETDNPTMQKVNKCFTPNTDDLIYSKDDLVFQSLNKRLTETIKK